MEVLSEQETVTFNLLPRENRGRAKLLKCLYDRKSFNLCCCTFLYTEVNHPQAMDL